MSILFLPRNTELRSRLFKKGFFLIYVIMDLHPIQHKGKEENNRLES